MNPLSNPKGYPMCKKLTHAIFFLGTLSVLALFFAGCSTAEVRVLPGEDGVNRVVSRDIERDGAEKEALKKAEKYCEDRHKEMVVVQEDKTAYEGSMDEESRKTIRNASKAAVLLGGPAGVLSNSYGVGGAVGAAGGVGYSMTSDRDYKAEFKFRCR
ncbi:MAG: hypothetical protein H7301_14305 [Cryobacterium sp.]|nr:hypothetical protein [Oligoflexia bacterium]